MNAKELALAKLHASLNLASMHTYLVSMGVPFKEVVAYTAKSKIFNDLYDLTKADSWSNLKGTLNNNVWKTLNLNAKNFTKQQIQNGEGYTLDDVKQLKRLHDWAAEFRALTLLLGINQGMKSGLAQAVSFKILFENIIANQVAKLDSFTSFATLLKNIDNAKQTSKTDDEVYQFIDNIIISHGLKPTQQLRDKYELKIRDYVKKYGEVKLPIKIDMNLYFTDIYYRQQIVDLYDIFKSTINIFDVINNSSNFFAMLRSLNEMVLKGATGAKGDFIFNKLTELWDRGIVNTTNFDIPYMIDETAIKDAQSFFDDYLVSDFIINILSKEYPFSYTISPNETTKEVKEVKFETSKDLAAFLQAFNTVVSRLKRNEKYKNEFTKSLISYERKDHRVLYKLNFNLDALNKNQAGELQLKYNEIVGGFNKLMNIPISEILQDYKGPQITVGDMFYLYNLIFNLGQRGQNTLTALLDSYIAKSDLNSILFKYLNNVKLFDLKQRDIVLDKIKFNYHIFKRYLPKDNPMFIEGRPYDPKDIILTNIDKVEEHKKLQNTYLKFIDAYKLGRVTITMDLNCN